MTPAEVIRAKRDGRALDEAQIDDFVRGLVTRRWSEGQVAALAMAILLNGMTRAEAALLTRAMTHSGQVLDWSRARLPGPVIDKHSTGGVGDKVSLMLAPIVAACGGVVPMISGRGLGHTGGTLDKLQSLAGYNVAPSRALLTRVLREAGCAIVGASARVAPADRRLYAIRDVTATVESVPLITASILSKKLAAGLQFLVMDVKAGNGAFCATTDAARELAQSIVQVAAGAGLPTRALITDMNQVLGRTRGNALEVQEAIDFLSGRGPREPRLEAVTLALCGEMLALAGLCADANAGQAQARRALDSGDSGRAVCAHGGCARRATQRAGSEVAQSARRVAAAVAGRRCDRRDGHARGRPCGRRARRWTTHRQRRDRCPCRAVARPARGRACGRRRTADAGPCARAATPRTPPWRASCGRFASPRALNHHVPP